MTFLKKRVEDSIKQAKLLAQRVVPAKPLGRRGYVCEWEDRADCVSSLRWFWIFAARKWLHQSLIILRLTFLFWVFADRQVFSSVGAFGSESTLYMVYFIYGNGNMEDGIHCGRLLEEIWVVCDEDRINYLVNSYSKSNRLSISIFTVIDRPSCRGSPCCVVNVCVCVHGVEVLCHVIEVDDKGVERDYCIIPPWVLVIFCLVVVYLFRVAEFFHQHSPIHNVGDWALGRAGKLRWLCDFVRCVCVCEGYSW